MCLCSEAQSQALTAVWIFHRRDTDEVDKVKIDVVCECPIEGKNIMKFKNNDNKCNHPFSVVADFESTLEKVDNSAYNVFSEEERKKSKIVKTQKKHTKFIWC